MGEKVFGFNSTMVRLKECYKLLQKNESEKFQFHYGTIKRQQNNADYE